MRQRQPQRGRERCLRRAAAVIFTTYSHLRHQLATFPFLQSTKCHVIFNGHELTTETPKQVSAEQKPDKDKITLAFVGTLADHALPASILRVLEVVLGQNATLRKRLTLRFIGKKSERARAQLEDFRFQKNLELVDLVPKPVADEYMRSSTALLLLAPEILEREIPGKLVDYGAAGPRMVV